MSDEVDWRQVITWWEDSSHERITIYMSPTGATKLTSSDGTFFETSAGGFDGHPATFLEEARKYRDEGHLHLVTD